MTAPIMVAARARAPRVAASWRVRLITVLPVLPLVAAQPIIAGLARIATSPVSEDVPQSGLELIAIGFRTVAAAALLVAVLCAGLARVEARHDRAGGTPTRVPWAFGVVPVLLLGARAIALRRLGRSGAGPFIVCVSVLGGGGFILLLELVYVIVAALQESVPLS